MGHRLPQHQGLCKNPHGHTYKLRIILKGKPNEKTGILIDYYDVEQIANKTINKFNHAFVVEDGDAIMKRFLMENDFKYVVIPFASTAENLCDVFANELIPQFNNHENIGNLVLRIYETSDVYAEKSYSLV